jgi:hypothetical protein
MVMLYWYLAAYVLMMGDGKRDRSDIGKIGKGDERRCPGLASLDGRKKSSHA